MGVFISHKHENQELFSSLCELLRRCSLGHWAVDTMIKGSDLADQLLGGIESCDVCIFLATEEALNSPWCLAEVGAFWGARKPVIVFQGEGFDEQKLPPQFSGQLHATSLEEVMKSAKFLVAKRRLLRTLEEPRGKNHRSFKKLREAWGVDWSDDFFRDLISRSRELVETRSPLHKRPAVKLAE